MLGVPTNHRDKGKEEQREYQNDLAAGQPKFSFAVCFNRQDVEQTIRGLSISSSGNLAIGKCMWGSNQRRGMGQGGEEEHCSLVHQGGCGIMGLSPIT